MLLTIFFHYLANFIKVHSLPFLTTQYKKLNLMTVKSINQVSSMTVTIFSIKIVLCIDL
uniref:Uncharacterized protein n=1 Tax=Arsenophonus nasoniae TaxID=638 RepID=D2TZ03_9GAMM|nr:hypothetical protein ARN_13950 [Arsenophonus nasoniae]